MSLDYILGLSMRNSRINAFFHPHNVRKLGDTAEIVYASCCCVDGRANFRCLDMDVFFKSGSETCRLRGNVGGMTTGSDNEALSKGGGDGSILGESFQNVTRNRS